jgi:hypothetical protein
MATSHLQNTWHSDGITCRYDYITVHPHTSAQGVLSVYMIIKKAVLADFLRFFGVSRLSNSCYSAYGPPACVQNVVDGPVEIFSCSIFLLFLKNVNFEMRTYHLHLCWPS